jgi:hypothetical protein
VDLLLNLSLTETLMIETLLASIIVGQVISGPNLIQTDYLTETNQVITVLETIQEVPN